MADTMKALSARVTAMEKAVAKFMTSETSGTQTKKMPATKKKAATRKAATRKPAAKKIRVRPPVVEELLPNGMPEFVTPMDKL